MSARVGWIAIAALVCAGLFALGRGEPAGADPGATVEAPAVPAAGEKIDVLLCDDQTKVTVVAQANPKRADGEKVASELMAQWRAKNPNNDWEADERRAHQLVPSADNSALVGNPQGSTYSQVTEREVLVWKTETERFALSGSRIFHNSDELGSTIAVSCDMCHPDAANTHPETYPKYQVQLGRTVLLRDMINWCIEHPVRGKRLAEDDPKMRALEAYIYAQRKGVPLDYGRR